MSNKRIENKSSRTAGWTCMCRALSFQENNPYYKCDDYVAPSLLPRILQMPGLCKLAIRLFAAKGIYQYVIARTKYIDAAVRQCIDSGFTQIVIFGAGFDTRALRFSGKPAKIRFFELDAPTTQKSKILQYEKRRFNIPPDVHLIPIDFDKESPSLKLEQSGFSRNEKSLFILEGVLMYLQPKSVDETLRTISGLALPGSEIVFDYVHASVLRHENTGYGANGAADMVSSQGEKWNFGIDENEIEQFLDGHHFRLIDKRNAKELETMYFTDESGRTVGRVNGTHCLARAAVSSSRSVIHH